MNKLLAFGALILIGLLVFRITDQVVKEKPASTIKTRKAESNKELSGPSLRGTNEKEEFGTVSGFVTDILDVNRSTLERTPEIMKLRQKKLSQADEKALLTHLAQVHKNESQAIKNDIIEHMVRYGSDKKQVGDTLLGILSNDRQDKVLREYVLQYVPEYYTSRWLPNEHWDDIEDFDRQKFNKILWEMTDLTEGSMAGGALFALFRLADKYVDLNQDEIFKKSMDVMVDPSYMNPNRMGAVQILSFSNNEKYFQAAKEIVMDDNQPTLLKVTAMHTATKSKVMDREFHAHLKVLAKGGDDVHPSLAKCANLTLSKIKY